MDPVQTLDPSVILQNVVSRTWSRSRPVLLSLGTTLTSEVVAGYKGYGCKDRKFVFGSVLTSDMTRY